MDTLSAAPRSRHAPRQAGAPLWSEPRAGWDRIQVVQLRINYFPGGDGFYGYRHGLELLTCLTPLLAFSLPWSGRWARRLLPVVAALQVGAIALGAVTESFLVSIDDVWTDNSLWLAVREVPAVAGTWMAVWAVVGVMASVVVHRRLAGTAELRLKTSQRPDHFARSHPCPSPCPTRAPAGAVGDAAT